MRLTTVTITCITVINWLSLPCDWHCIMRLARVISKHMLRDHRLEARSWIPFPRRLPLLAQGLGTWQDVQALKNTHYLFCCGQVPLVLKLAFLCSSSLTHTHTHILLPYWGRPNRGLTWCLQYVHHTHIAQMHLYPEWSFLLFWNIYLFLWLPWVLSCSMWDLVPCLGIKTRSSALRVRSLGHWTTKEISRLGF